MGADARDDDAQRIAGNIRIIEEQVRLLKTYLDVKARQLGRQALGDNQVPLFK